MASHRAPLLALALAVLAPATIESGPRKLGAELVARITLAHPGQGHTVWVYFRDKGGAQPNAAAEAGVSARALARRARRGTLAAESFEDLPLARAYVAAVEARVLRLRHELRWLNAVSAVATGEQLGQLEALPFVERIELVRGFRRGPDEPVVDRPLRAAGRGELATPHAINYGASLGQLQQLGVPTLHDRGLHGEGVVVAVLDAGFDNLAHEVFATTRILATRDFVNGDDDVGDGRDRGRGSHGTATLSVLGGYREGQLVGPAFAAGFLLAKTEDTGSETPV